MIGLIMLILLGVATAIAVNQLNDPKVLAKVKKFLRIGKKKDEVEAGEDPVKLAEASIADLKTDLGESMKALAEVKALAVRTQREVSVALKSCADYEQKAMEYLEMAQNGNMSQEEAERKALHSLEQKDRVLKSIQGGEASLKNYQDMVKKLEVNTQQIKAQVIEWENELKTLKARSRVSEASRKMHERMSKLDTHGTNSILDKMRTDTEEKEILAEAYSDLNNPPKSKIDEEVDKILGGSSTSALSALNQLKQKVVENASKNAPIPPKVEEQKAVEPPKVQPQAEEEKTHFVIKKKSNDPDMNLGM